MPLLWIIYNEKIFKKSCQCALIINTISTSISGILVFFSIQHKVHIKIVHTTPSKLLTSILDRMLFYQDHNVCKNFFKTLKWQAHRKHITPVPFSLSHSLNIYFLETISLQFGYTRGWYNNYFWKTSGNENTVLLLITTITNYHKGNCFNQYKSIYSLSSGFERHQPAEVKVLAEQVPSQWLPGAISSLVLYSF